MAVVLFMGLSFSASSQQKEITGKVTTEEGSVLAGASVSVKGSSNSTMTNEAGEFKFNISTSAKTLVISFVNYESQELSIGNQNRINATLKTLSTELENVVVTVLGFKERGDKLGSSVSRINTSEVVKSGETGLLQGMAGKASGVTITRSTGDPGAGSSIKIRGANTIDGNTQPLIIVDGIPISNSETQGLGSSAFGTGVAQQSRLNDINPNDIESIQVLKGASAAALWGSRAANGVLVITTKKGKAGAIKISYSSTYSIDEINRKHPLQNTYGQGSNGVYSPTAANSWGDRIDARSGLADITTGTAYFEGYATGTKYYRVTGKNNKETFVDKNFNQIFGNGHYLQNAINLSGGNDKSRFFLSLENMNQKGIIRAGSDYKRNSIRLNSDHTLTSWLKFSTKAAYVNLNSNRIQQNSNVGGLYLGLLRTAPDFDQTDYLGTYYDANGVASRNRHRSYRRYLADNVQPTYNNPLWTINEDKSPNSVDRFIMSTEINANPVSWLELILRAGIDGSFDSRRYFFRVGSAGDRNLGNYREEKISEVEKNIDLIAKASKDITKDLKGTLIVGGNINERNREITFGEATNFLDDIQLNSFALSADAFTHLENRIRKIGSNRGYSSLNLDYKDQLFVNFTGALEAASSIPKAFFYPSVDLAWQFSKLTAFENSNVLSFGKIRAAWGKVGVQPEPYRTVTTYESAVYDAYDDALALTNFGGGYRLNNNQGNENLRPEIKSEWEIGADLRFFRNKFSLGMAYYENKTKDVLLEVGLPPSVGFTTIYANAGTIQNKGFEADFKLNILETKSHGIELYGNFNRNRNLVVDMSGSTGVDLTGGSMSSRAVAGYPLGVLWGPRALRDAKGAFALDANGFPQIDASQGVVGDPNPDWRGAAGLKGNYKGFDASILFETFQGGDVSQGTKSVLYNFGTHADVGHQITLTEPLKNVNGVVFPTGRVVRGNVGNYGGGNVLLDQAWYTSRGAGLGGSSIRELFVTDGSWTRLREVSFGYTLNTPAFKKATKFSSMRFSFSGRNLVLWSDVVGFDPEINQTGVGNGFGLEYFTNPSTRSFLFTISLNY